LEKRGSSAPTTFHHDTYIYIIYIYIYIEREREERRRMRRREIWRIDESMVSIPLPVRHQQ